MKRRRREQVRGFPIHQGAIFHLTTDCNTSQLPLLPFKAALRQHRNYECGSSQRMRFRCVLQMQDSSWATREAAPPHLGLRCLLTGSLSYPREEPAQDFQCRSHPEATKGTAIILFNFHTTPTTPDPELLTPASLGTQIRRG